MKVPGPDHPISVVPTRERVIVRLGERVVADSERAVSLSEAGYPTVQYIPLEDVDQQVLRSSDTVTTCPYKGEASYYSIAIGDTSVTDAVWVYRDPHPAVAPIAGHAAFYPNKVQISVG